MYDKCYFCLDQLPKLKKESTASFFVNFGRSRGTKEPTYITVHSSRASGWEDTEDRRQSVTGATPHISGSQWEEREEHFNSSLSWPGATTSETVRCSS